MKKYSIILSILFGLLVSSTFAQQKKGDWEFTLAGGGTSDNEISNTSFGLNATIGYYIADRWNIDLRQGLSYTESPSHVIGTTGVATDFSLFKIGPVSPFIGANAQVKYGSGDADVAVGPEAGLRIFLTSQTFIYGRVGYEFDLTNRHGSDGDWLAYTLGIGVDF